MHGSCCKKQKFIACNSAEKLRGSNLTVQAEGYAKVNKCYLERKTLRFCYILIFLVIFLIFVIFYSVSVV